MPIDPFSTPAAAQVNPLVESLLRIQYLDAIAPVAAVAVGGLFLYLTARAVARVIWGD